MDYNLWSLSTLIIINRINKDLIKDIKESANKAIRDVSPKDSEDHHKTNDDSDKINWKSLKIWALILASPLLIEVIKALVSLFGQGTNP
jgi:hypothetical protein